MDALECDSNSSEEIQQSQPEAPSYFSYLTQGVSSYFFAQESPQATKAFEPFTVSFSDELTVKAEAKLSEGAFAFVFKCRQTNSENYFALKQITAAQSPEVTQREAEVWQSLKHPNILPLVAHCDN
jgi:hypothetical protein